MSSIVTAVFKATIGLLVNKGRDVAAERLKEGDVTDQKFRGLIVREIDDIKSKLDGLARKDLLASMSFFKEGIELLYEVFQRASPRSECGAATAQAAATDSAEAVSLAQGIRTLDLTDLDESATRTLANAKKRFERAREKATEAFANQALELSDRVLAMQYRVMATILETVDNPEDALSACRVCIEELHCLSAVKECFTVELKKGFWARFSKDERRKIISTVCHVNRVIYDVTLMTNLGKKELSANNWPCVDTEEKKVDPLRDASVAKVLQKQGMEHCCVTPPWSFGQEGEEEHKLKDPCGIATNTDGQFIITDKRDKTVKVFSSSGKFLHSFKPQTDDADTELVILDVAINLNSSNIYVLVRLNKPGTEGWELEMHVHQNSGDRLNKFPVRRGVWGWGRLTVSSNKVLVLWKTDGGKRVVDVYNHDGGYVCSFGEGILKYAWDITTVPDGSVMVPDRGDDCVHVFTEDGTQLNKFNINTKGCNHTLASHPAGEHVVIACEELGTARPRVDIYTKDGEFVRAIALDEERIDWFGGITVTMEGHIAVAVRDEDDNSKVIVI